MSKLGNVNQTYGEQINIAIANASDTNLFSSTNLHKNTIIICAENNGSEDVGTYSLSITDNYGTPVRLTYTIERIPALTYNNSLHLNIDTNTLVSKNKLSVVPNNLFDSAHISYGKLSIQSNNLLKGNAYQGVIKIDNNTVKITSGGQLYVESNNLEAASNYSFGVAKSDNKTISIIDGKISVNAENLTLCNLTTYGAAKISETIGIKDDGVLYVNTNGLQKASDTQHGVIKVDGTTIVSNNGVLSTNTNILDKATSTTYGVAKFASKYFTTKNGIISVNNYDDILKRINIAYNALPNIYTQLTYYSNKRKKYETTNNL